MKRFPIHPLLAGLYPVLVLLAHNIDQVRVTDALRPLAITLLAALLLLCLLRLLIRDWQRAALVCTLFLILFFSYGHIYNYFEGARGWAGILGRHRVLIPLWLILAGVGGWWAVKRIRDLSVATLTLNAIFVVALIFPVVQLASYGIRSASVSGARNIPPELENLRLPSNPPDVYFVILDAYAREDELDETYDFDNTPFLNALSEMGFSVAPCSQSNYAQTELSLAATLNLNYFDTLGVHLPSGSDDRSPLRPLLRHSAVRRVFERLGYKTVAFDSGFYRTQFDDVDVYLSNKTEAFGGINGFESLLIKTSAGLAIADFATILPKILVPDVDAPKKQLRETIRYELDKLGSLPTSLAGPKFVFVHIMAPHEPFLFGPDGEAIIVDPQDEATYITGYRDQVIYLNKRLEPLLREIIANSPTPPIIILQGDHGPGWASASGRMEILNALYLPGGSQHIYETVSPVNTFRIVFNEYFGGKLPLLDDVSYFSTYQKPYNFSLVENRADTCGK